MILFPNAKINLGLNIVEKRPDGFHNIETCFFPVKWCDIIEITESRSTTFKLSGIAIPGNPDENLCIKAFQLLQSDYDLPEITIHLHKNIPIGAGLGGGSADAAFVLTAINEKYQLSIDRDTLKKYASKIGSDCSFFIDNKPSVASGKGEILEPIDLDLSGLFIVLIYPNIHIDTKTAYSGIVSKKPDYPIKKTILKKSVVDWKYSLVNDFEENVFRKFAEIKEVKTKLYDLGATYSAMSGSGSTVFGIFNQEINIKKEFPVNYSIQAFPI